MNTLLRRVTRLETIDGGVDFHDFSIFASCAMVPRVTYAGGCDYADPDIDFDVDFVDPAQLQSAFADLNRAIEGLGS